MRKIKSLVLPLALGCHISLYAPLVLAGDASVTISSPSDGAKLSRTEQTTINYEVTPGPEHDHIHLYVDNNKAGALRRMKGSHTLELLASGKHKICIEVANKGHAQIGVSKCIDVSVE